MIIRPHLQAVPSRFPILVLSQRMVNLTPHSHRKSVGLSGIGIIVGRTGKRAKCLIGWRRDYRSHILGPTSESLDARGWPLSLLSRRVYRRRRARSTAGRVEATGFRSTPHGHRCPRKRATAGPTKTSKIVEPKFRCFRWLAIAVFGARGAGHLHRFEAEAAHNRVPLFASGRAHPLAPWNEEHQHGSMKQRRVLLAVCRAGGTGPVSNSGPSAAFSPPDQQ
jgi:hypothetical protein